MINLFLSQNENLKLVRVSFPGNSKLYTYKTLLDIKEDQEVIVESPRDGMTIVKVHSVTPAIESNLTFSYSLKWIVQVVDTAHYEQCLNMERELNKEINKLKAQKARKELLEEAKLVLGSESVDNLIKLVRL